MPVAGTRFAGAMAGMTLKAWALVDNAGTLIKSFNIASHSKPQAGNYAFTFSVPMATVNYVVDVKYNAVSSIYVAGVGSKSTAGGTVVSRLVSGGTLNDLPDSPILMAFYE